MQKLNKSIFSTLFFSIFATVTGVGIVVPLLPVYAHDLGAGGLYIGLIFGAFSLSRSVLMPYFGRQSDKKGRKPYIVPGMFAYTLISIAFVFSKNINSLIVLRFVQGAASAMLLPVIQAYVGDITPRGREGFTMGIFNMSLFLGLSLGPLLGGVIKDHFSLNAAFFQHGEPVIYRISTRFIPAAPHPFRAGGPTGQTPGSLETAFAGPGNCGAVRLQVGLYRLHRCYLGIFARAGSRRIVPFQLIHRCAGYAGDSRQRDYPRSHGMVGRPDQ